MPLLRPLAPGGRGRVRTCNPRRPATTRSPAPDSSSAGATGSCCRSTETLFVSATRSLLQTSEGRPRRVCLWPRRRRGRPLPGAEEGTDAHLALAGCTAGWGYSPGTCATTARGDGSPPVRRHRCGRRSIPVTSPPSCTGPVVRRLPLVELVWLASSVGIVAGTLGSGLETEQAVRNAICGRRNASAGAAATRGRRRRSDHGPGDRTLPGDLPRDTFHLALVAATMTGSLPAAAVAQLTPSSSGPWRSAGVASAVAVPSSRL